ncbi:MAG: hydantoinase B/oxoprolinase family protein [Lautropia sp.]
MLDSVTTQIFWNRIISIVDEAATGLIRTAYSAVVRDFHDFACGLFDRDGNLLAHSVKTTTAFIGVMPFLMKHFIEAFPPETLAPGDALITNDPWLGTGHTYDLCIASPIFHGSRLIGFAICIVHHLDIGGRLTNTESKDMYEEGLRLPIVRFARDDIIDPTLEAVICANVRAPVAMMGDIRAQLTANSVCSRGLLAMIEDYRLDDSTLIELAREIASRSEASLRRRIAAVPAGRYENEVVLPTMAGIDGIRIKVALTFAGDEVTVDFTGSSAEVAAGVNVTLNMTRSYSLYPIKMALDPEVPNNEGCIRPIRVIVPEGTLLNCRPPAPTWGRIMICHNLPEIIFGALVKAIPDRIPAACGSTPIVLTNLRWRHPDGRLHIGMTSGQGGMGASARGDGASCRGFPYNVGNVPVETIENDLPLIYTRKELLADSGGPGTNRGGLGQCVEFRVADNHLAPELPIDCLVRGVSRRPDSVYPVFGRKGGQVGRGAAMAMDGKPLTAGTPQKLGPGRDILIALPGGGGYGDPLRRAPEDVLADVRQGYVSRAGAEADYGVRLSADGTAIDHAATEALRAARSPGHERD